MSTWTDYPWTSGPFEWSKWSKPTHKADQRLRSTPQTEALVKAAVQYYSISTKRKPALCMPIDDARQICANAFSMGRLTVTHARQTGVGRGGLPKSGDQPHAKQCCVRCPAISDFSQSFHCAHQPRNLSTPRNRFGRVKTMFERVFIPLRCSRGHPPVHPASAVRHRRRLARVPAPRSGSASRAEVHGQFVAHSVGSPSCRRLSAN